MFKKILFAVAVVFGIATAPSTLQSCRAKKVTESDSVTIVTQRYDSLIYVDRNGPILWLPSPCEDICDSMGHLKKFDFIKKEHGLIVELKSVGDSLVETCNADSLTILVQGLRQEIKEKDQLIIENETPCKKEHRTSFDNFCRWSAGIFWFSVLVLVISVIIYVAKKK